MSALINENYYTNKTQSSPLGQRLCISLNTSCSPAEMTALPGAVYNQLRQHIIEQQSRPSIASIVIVHPHIAHDYAHDSKRQLEICAVIANIFTLIATIPGLCHLSIAYTNGSISESPWMDTIGHAIAENLAKISQGTHASSIRNLIVDITVRDVQLPLVIRYSEAITRMLLDNKAAFPSLSVFENYMNVKSNNPTYKFNTRFIEELGKAVAGCRQQAITGGGFHIQYESA